MNQQDLLEVVNNSVENKALPGAMWFVMLMDGREVQRPLTFLLTTRENDSNGIYHSITWTKSLDFVIDISKINALKFMASFSNFIGILMEAKPEFFNDSSFTKIIKSFSNEWGFADDFIIALNMFFDERAMEPDYNPNEPIRWSYTCGNNAPGDFDIYKDLLFSRIANLRTKEELLTPEESGEQTVLPDTQYGSCLLTTFKEAKVYFVDSLKSLQKLENDLGRKDLVQAPKRDMENWFIYPEPRGKTIRLNNFDFVVVLGRGDYKSPYVPVIAHEAMHVVLSLCKQIGYDPLNEQEPAAYAMEYLVKQALGFFALNEGASSK